MKKVIKIGIGLVAALLAFALMLILGTFFGTFVLEILRPGRPKGPNAYMQIGPIWTTDPYALLLGFLIALYSGGQTFRWVVWPPKKKKEKSNAIHIPLDGGSLDDPGQSTQK